MLAHTGFGFLSPPALIPVRNLLIHGYLEIPPGRHSSPQVAWVGVNDKSLATSLGTGSACRLRHTVATLLFAERINPKVVSEMLGHSDIAVTLGLYGHVTPPMQQDAANAMDMLFDTGEETDTEE